MPHPPLLLLGVAAAVAFAGCVQGIIGFGFGLVSMALLPLMLGVKGAVPVVAALALTINTTLAVRFREHLSFRDAAPLFLGALLGIPVGVFALTEVSSDGLMVGLGVIVIGYAGWSLAAVQAPPSMGRKAGWGLGLLSGLMGGAFGTAGPPAVVWVSSQPWSSQKLRATLVALFSMAGALQVSLLIRAGLLTTGTASLSALALPAAGLGSLLGARLGDRIPQEVFRKVMLSGLAVVGVGFVMNGLRGG